MTSDELLEQIKSLKREITRLRSAVRAQRLRAELWRERAMKKR